MLAGGHAARAPRSVRALFPLPPASGHPASLTRRPAPGCSAALHDAISVLPHSIKVVPPAGALGLRRERTAGGARPAIPLFPPPRSSTSCGDEGSEPVSAHRQRVRLAPRQGFRMHGGRTIFPRVVGQSGWGQGTLRPEIVARWHKGAAIIGGGSGPVAGSISTRRAADHGRPASPKRLPERTPAANPAWVSNQAPASFGRSLRPWLISLRSVRRGPRKTRP